MKKRRTWILPGILALILVIAATSVWYWFREQGRWDAYFTSLRQQPGVVVTSIEKSGSEYVVTGLKDPLAPDLRHQHVRFAWQPYLSLNTEFARAREFLSAKDQLESLLIRFDAGLSKLPQAEAWRLDQVALAVAKVVHMHPASRILLTGRADEVGSAGTNNKLSLERSERVLEALLAQGLPKEWFDIVAVGNTQPLRKGTSDWDRSANRSVSFQVH